MSFSCATWRHGLPVLALAGVLSTLARPALAQESSSSGSEAVVFVGGIDVANQYVFRGVRQNSTGLAVWPFVDLTARVLSGEGPVKRLDVSARFWNSVQTGDTGSGGPYWQSVVRGSLFRSARIQIRWRRVGGIGLHGVHQPERHVHDREGD